jgi:coenzyme F420-reducing hydrogenase gamma subunit
MEPEDRVKLVEHHDLCLGCLTPGHGRAARSCPHTEE